MEVPVTERRPSLDPWVWGYHAKRALTRWDLTPGQFAAAYLLLGFLALYWSDVVLVRAVEDPALLSQLQAVKGGLEVAVTAGLIFVLTRRSRRALERTNDRLERQQEELQVLHRVLRHNLRNDVNVIAGYAELLSDAVSPDDRPWAKNIEAATERVVRYTERARTINRVTADHTLTTVDAAAVVRSVAADFRADGVTLEVSVPEAAPVYCHPMLEAAVEELLENALQHHDREEPWVAISIDEAAGPAHTTDLVVEDDGPGIPNHIQETIEERHETPLTHLEGLGLWVVWWVVTASDSRLDIADREPRGTEIRIRLPKAADTRAASSWLSGLGEADA